MEFNYSKIIIHIKNSCYKERSDHLKEWNTKYVVTKDNKLAPYIQV